MSSVDPTLELETSELQAQSAAGQQETAAAEASGTEVAEALAPPAVAATDTVDQVVAERRRSEDVEGDVIEAGRDVAQVVVSVGTDHHRFDRLIGWMDEWRRANLGVTVLIQRGTSAPSELGGCHELIPHADLLRRFAEATAVVSHGGPSTVMDARMSGRFPIVMARNPAYEEHVDDHQMRFADHLKKHGVADVVDTKQGLFDALERAMTNPDAYTVPVSDAAAEGIHEFGRLVDGLMGA